MTLFIAIAFFVVISAAVFAFGYYQYIKPSRFLDTLANSTSEVIRSVPRREKTQFSLARLLEPVGSLLPISSQDASVLRRELISAGFRSDSAVTVFYGVKLVLAVVGVLVALATKGGMENPLMKMMVPVFGGVIGYILPGFGLSRLIKRRHNQIRLALPDVLDLMVICTEAGCGLDQALVNVARELKDVHKAISEEINQVNMEMMAGKSRAEALRNLSQRTDEEEIIKLVAILIQSDRFGTIVGEALRTQYEFLLIRRRQIAEERSGKVGVKLVFPIFFFCMPSLMVVTTGPAMIQLFHNLFPAMRGGH
jgi:tight adherence protein C